MSKQISRKRIVELMQESTEAPYQFDDGWIRRFMHRLNQESPTLVKAIQEAAKKRTKELDDKTL